MSMSSRGSGPRIGAVKIDVTWLHAVLVGKAINFAGDVACLGVLGFSDVTDDFRARTGGGPHFWGDGRGCVQ